ncbi:hypothetical protein MCOR27_005985 [Pyricularia oryzae]|uniref:Uncharacterized protein n=1 Tax=Pyricularia grisea TaxID=148305 RepID=A0ABQ8NI58_PYRGI|nr:hypothetical protein MCOR26_007375 [Pyricularia oryzae]KAI6296128.1 hypothetical protein MCOR33_007161 [Pyricularia grisea]KAI6277452.1 hypothetical protein MCOR27_005985 [Pyricularia oryzae]KAI6310810.1 hypothetical protein MCOR30_011017 [Pyricularia oryzae]KAI6320951.1 hypothetical protein MCOR29_005083 [Pyricularia oryzae]
MSPQTNIKMSWLSRIKRYGGCLVLDCCRPSKAIKPYEGELWPNPENFHWSHKDRRFDCTPIEAGPVQTQPRPSSNMRVPSQLSALPVRVLSPTHPRLSQDLPPLPLPEPPVKIRSSIEPSQVFAERDGAASRSSSRLSSSTAGSKSSSRRSANEDERFERFNRKFLGASIIDEVLGIFDKVSNMPYAVCGMAALAAWGYTLDKPRHITIMVPPYCRDTMTGWAKTVPQFETFASRPDVIGVQTSDGTIVRINITYPDAADGVWEDYFKTNRVQLHGIGEFAEVLRLSKLLNQTAVSYMDALELEDAELMGFISSDILWILWRIARGLAQGEENIKPLNPTEIPSVMDRTFWDSFVGTHPEASERFAAAGLHSRFQPSGDVRPLMHSVPQPSNPYWQPSPPTVETVDPMTGSSRTSMPTRTESASTVRLTPAEKLKQRFQQPRRQTATNGNGQPHTSRASCPASHNGSKSVAQASGPFRQSL